MTRLVQFADRLGSFSRRLGTFVFYLPLMVRVGSLSLWPREGSRAHAIAICERQRRKRPFAPVPHLFLIDLHVAEGSHGRVAELCEELTLLGYFSPTVAKKQAYALCHLERFREAALVLEAALDDEDPDAWILECLGNCYFTLAESSLARKSYLNCLDLAVTGEVRGRVEDLVRQVEALLGYRRGDMDES